VVFFGRKFPFVLQNPSATPTDFEKQEATPENLVLGISPDLYPAYFTKSPANISSIRCVFCFICRKNFLMRHPAEVFRGCQEPIEPTEPSIASPSDSPEVSLDGSNSIPDINE